MLLAFIVYLLLKKKKKASYLDVVVNCFEEWSIGEWKYIRDVN